MKVPVILLNYNSSADCCKCVADLKQQEGVELEIIMWTIVHGKRMPLL